MNRIMFPIALLAMLLLVGCVTTDVELTAADAIEEVARAWSTALVEYHGEVLNKDAADRNGVVKGYTKRLLADHADAGKVAVHEKQFMAALDKLAMDTQTESTRHARLLTANKVLADIAAGLRRTAFDAMSLRDETRRYFSGLIERKRKEAPSG